MAISREEIEALVEEIVHGAEEEYVAKLTETMIEEFSRGLDYSGAMDLQTLLRRFPSKASSILLEYKGKISDEVYNKIEEALRQAAAEDLTSLAAIYGRVKVAEGASKHFETLSKQTAHGITKIIERQNVALSQSLNMTWYKVAGDAVTAVNSGLVPRSKALADGVVKLINAGITVVPYTKNGRATVTNHVDVALRRHLTTQVSQAGGRMSLEAMDLYNHELVITDAHYGARPTHAEWQGLPACRTGRKVVDGIEYPGLGELTGYGDVGGLKGANCRHMIFAYYPGISKLPDREFRRLKKQFGMTSDEYYTATQRQRELERRIRKTKREIAGMEQAGLGLENPAYVQKRLVLGKQQTMIKNHCEKTGLVRIYEREKAYGVIKQPMALRAKPKAMPYSNMSEKSVENFIFSHVVPGNKTKTITRNVVKVTSKNSPTIIFSEAISDSHRTEVIKQARKLPKELKNSVHTIEVVDYDNPADSYWRKRYRGFTKSAGTGGNGKITLYGCTSGSEGKELLGYLAHEAGHCYDGKGIQAISGSTTWKEVIRSDQIRNGKTHITKYGMNSEEEEFAESVKWLVLRQNGDSLPININGKIMEPEDVFPRRFEFLKELLKYGH